MADLDASVAETQKVLQAVISKPKLTEALLKKPPFRFLHDIVTEVKKQTGFPAGLTDHDQDSNNFKDKESKIAYLTKVIGFVTDAVGPIAVKPQKIVAGLEPENTNAWLQGLAKASSSSGGAAPAPAPKPAAAPAPAKAAAVPAKASSSSKANVDGIDVKVSFNAPAKEVFECFTVPNRVMAYTQSKCEVGTEPGQKLSLFDGSITGETVSCTPNEKLVWLWRQAAWPEGKVSTVTMTFEQTSPGTTEVAMRQTGVPAEDVHGNSNMRQVVEEGWKRNIFDRIKMVFGFGTPQFS
eukprot:CAMPEP_0173378580 /NCGR_PEP_ID=MMETSP1356-20130122/1726_1 /TAXON_ID=77927 ORGANISM="Hemiselmis virescens, Strain PCC157" /NCGR_SAMPLE_ID=MMETSP1356 /ASSEMBLY_ACC=CAM_ASM_000847 /LENGTH=294 /DNA_ID=CAMNT_0014331689 /DNA_START=11 /DNA_END=895 /DNA_ORIENTATION=-